MSLIRESWRGERPLYEIFWIVYFGGYMVFMLVFLVGFWLLPESFSDFILIPFLFFIAVYTIWAFVSIWRCAKNSKPVYQILARGWIVLSIVSVIIKIPINYQRYNEQEEKAKVKVASAQIWLLGTALDTLRLDVGRYPTTQEGLEALIRQPGSLERWDGSYLKKEVPLDPWGRPYIYRSPGEQGPYDLISYGTDGLPGGEGNNRDIASWEK